MGLPSEMWETAPSETGPMLETEEDWMEVAQAAPIQPQLGDMMIGSPMSVRNASNAVKAGVNYIGNMSQMGWKYPGWPGTDADQMIEMIKALGILAQKRSEGFIFQSYLEDGFPAQFKDYSSYIGWVMFERYLVTDLIGANLSVSFGGLSHDTIMKVAMVNAIEELTPDDICNAFFHCNTTAQTRQIDNNYCVVAVDDYYLALAMMHSNSGAALLSIPVTEAVRIPTWQEVVQVRTIAERSIQYARDTYHTINWDFYETITARLIENGRVFYDNLMNGFVELGVDVEDPLQLLLTARRIGGLEIENRWGAGDLPKTDRETYKPILPTDTYKDFERHRLCVREFFDGFDRDVDKSQTVIVGSTDIHEYAMFLLVDALETIGVRTVLAGTNVDPDEFADLALETNASAILASTHNGMALTYSKHLKRELEKRDLSIPVAMGGTLNQDIEGNPTPVDVTDDLKELGVFVCERIEDLVKILKPAQSAIDTSA